MTTNTQKPDPMLTILNGDALEMLRTLPDNSIQCCVTSPPYWGLRDYGVEGQIGMEATPAEFVVKMVEVFSEVRRVLKADGALWMNLGDSYANDDKWGGSTGGKHASSLHGNSGVGRGKRNTGLKSKDLVGIPWRVAFALQSDGWYLRQDIIWSKPNPMPESVRDRCTKSHEYLFLLSKSERYFYDAEAVMEPAVCSRMRGPALHRDTRSTNGNGGLSRREPQPNRNRRSVWTIATRPYKGAHFATFPPDLIRPCVLAGSRPGDAVLDPFGGSGTTAQVAIEAGRQAVLIELNPEYIPLIRSRCDRLLTERSRPKFVRAEQMALL